MIPKCYWKDGFRRKGLRKSVVTKKGEGESEVTRKPGAREPRDRETRGPAEGQEQVQRDRGPRRSVCSHSIITTTLVTWSDGQTTS